VGRALPPAGVWTRIDIPASELGLDSTTIQDLDMISYDGHTFFDASASRNSNGAGDGAIGNGAPSLLAIARRPECAVIA